MKLGPVLALFGLAGCAGAPLPPPLANGEIFIVGQYRYEDGDRVTWACDLGRDCDDALIRDETLQRLVERRRFYPARVVFVARRVQACGPESSQVTCL